MCSFSDLNTIELQPVCMAVESTSYFINNYTGFTVYSSWRGLFAKDNILKL